MVRYFYGLDTWGARLAIEELAGTLKRRIRWVTSAGGGEDTLVEQLAAPPGLWGAELPVVGTFSAWPARQREQLVASWERVADQEAVLWDEGEPDRRAAWWRLVEGSAREFPSLTIPQLIQWLGQEATSQRGRISAAAARSLVRRLGTDRGRLKHELDRLLVRHEDISEAAVADAVSPAAEAEVFLTLAALVRGEMKTVVRNVETLLQRGNSELYLLALFAYQFRLLYWVATGREERQAAEVIAQRYRFHPYAVRQCLPLARLWSRSAAAAALARILATDFAIKQGTVDARTALFMLVVNLTQHAESQKARAKR